jgi:serine phosphatase RsbU (regulator of sigma subunit)
MALETHQSERVGANQTEIDYRRGWLSRLPLWPRRSIRARLQLSHLVTSLLPLLILGSALLYTSAQAERRIVEQSQLSVAGSVARDIADMLAQTESDLLAFGRRLPLSSSNRTLIDEATKDFVLRRYPAIVEIAVLNVDGQERSRVSQTKVYFAGELINRLDEPFFLPGMQGLIHRDVVQDESGRRTVQISVPAHNSVGQVVGVVVATLGAREIEQSLATVPADAGRSAFVMDQWGNVLLGEAAPELLGTRSLHDWAPSPDAVRQLEGRDGSEIIAARATIEPGTWSVVVEQPSDSAYFSSRRNTWLLGMMLLLTSVVVVMWALSLARELTRPIIKLRDAVRSLGSGGLGNTIVVRRDDELGDLAREFNRMSLQLAESQQAIEQRNERLSEGLALARMVQHDLLPRELPPHGSIIAHAASEPASEIGGDFYTYTALPDGRLRLIIGDVSGKGVAAALVMALTSSLVDLAARDSRTPAEVLQRLNAELVPRLSSSHMGVSLLVAEFDPDGRRARIANAGMISPLVARPDDCVYVPCYGPPLGVVEQASFVEATLDLDADHAVVFISDGIVEARDESNTMWGFHRFETTVCAAAGGGPAAIIAAVLGEVRRFTGDGDPADDMTIIAATLAPRADAETPHAYDLVATAGDPPPAR